MCPNRQFNRQAGFSLMELLIAMAVMLIITGASLALVGSSLKFANATYNMTDAEQSLRTAHEVINRDLTTSGHGLRGMGTILVPRSFVQNYLTQTPIIDASNPNYVNLALVVSDNNVPANTAVPQASPAVPVKTGADRLTMLTQDISFNLGQPVTLLAGSITFVGANTLIAVPNATLFHTGEMYAIASQQSIAFGIISSIAGSVLTMTNEADYGINQTGATAPINVVTAAGTQPAALIRLQMIHYYLNADNLLIRRVFGVPNVTFVDSVVAEHVTSLQFRYLLNQADLNGNIPQPASQLTNGTQQAVREVETTVGVETVQAINAVTANNNGRQSISATTATCVRNMQFRQAQ